MSDSMIRLHYIWFKDYLCFHNQGINFSAKYKFFYDDEADCIKIIETKKDEYIDNFFGDNIDVTAIVGQNGTGKTSLLRFIQCLRNGDIIETECLIVCEKESKIWAGRYYNVNSQIPFKALSVNGLTESECIFDKPENQRFPFGEDIRFIYLTEMFNMFQYESSLKGGDDLSFAAVLYEQTEFGDEEKHIQNPVVRYIHRITDWQLKFLSNGAEYVEQFHINYPSYISISPNYDKDAFIKLYTTIKRNDNIRTKPYRNNEFKKEAINHSHELFGTKNNIKDEYAKAILMNIISSLDYHTNVTNYERITLYNMIEQIYDSNSKSSTWESTYIFLREIIDNNAHYNSQSNTGNEEVLVRVHIDAEPYIEFMDYLSKILDDESLYNKYTNTIYIPTSNMDDISTFFNNYKKCIKIVDFLSFSWGLSSGEKLLLNQYGKLMHLLKKDDKGYYLPEDVNSDFPAKNAVIMLDEAEVSFHPEWQRIYFKAMLNFIKKSICGQGTHVQLIIATHSPIILSDIPKQNTVFLKKDEDGQSTVTIDGEETFAANIFSLYRNAFFLDEAGIGAFAEDKLCKLVKKIHELFETSECPSEGNKNRVIQQINMIGDPYIRRKFEMEYQHCKENFESEKSKKQIISDRIAEKEKELEELKRKYEELGE